MKPVSIHPFSALTGAGLLGLVLLAAGAVQTPVVVQEIPIGGGGLVRVAGIPDPRDMMVIKEGGPFLVPPGKILVLTAVGTTVIGSGFALLVDGQQEIHGVANLPTVGPTTIGSLPPGFTVTAGSTVSVTTGATFGRAWGYLADA